MEKEISEVKEICSNCFKEHGFICAAKLHKETCNIGLRISFIENTMELKLYHKNVLAFNFKPKAKWYKVYKNNA